MKSFSQIKDLKSNLNLRKLFNINLKFMTYGTPQLPIPPKKDCCSTEKSKRNTT